MEMEMEAHITKFREDSTKLVSGATVTAVMSKSGGGSESTQTSWEYSHKAVPKT